jgi:hypothetical protein
MSFQIHIGLIGLSAPETKQNAVPADPARRIHSTYDRHYRLLNSPTVAISDSQGDTLASGLLSDNADWNAAYWELLPEYLDLLVELVETWFLSRRKASRSARAGLVINQRLALCPSMSAPVSSGGIDCR